MNTSKTEVLIFALDDSSMGCECNIEANGCFTMSQSDFDTVLQFHGEPDPEKIKITRRCGELMKIDKLRKRDNMLIIWNAEHKYGKRGKNKQ